MESLEHDTNEVFSLYDSSWDIVPSGSAKGYVHSTGPLSPTVNDLDEHGSGDGYTYRHVSGPWYLFSESW